MSDLDSEDAELLEAAYEVEGAEQSPWQPSCIARAFMPCEPLGVFQLRPLTMQGWLRLDAARSPYLPGAPECPEEQRLEALATAIGILSEDYADVSAAAIADVLTPEGGVEQHALVTAIIADAFSTILPMTPPNGPGAGRSKRHGFGNWILIYTCLLKEIGLAPKIADGLWVKRALAIIPAARANEGWTPAGTNYKARDVGEEVTNG